MSKLFLHLLNISITAGWIVLIVVLLRFVLKKAPKWTRVVLWGLVALRLLLPVSIESVTSLVPSAATVSVEPVTQPSEMQSSPVVSERIVIETGIPAVNRVVNPPAETAAKSAGTVAVLKTVAGWVWLAGAIGMLLYAAISYLVLRHRVRASLRVEKGVYVCDGIRDPFILGLLFPKIYLPSGTDETTRGYVLSHERAHLRRFDHIWKPLGFLLLSVYWFNPLLWLAYILLCRDIELACDEKVVKDLDDAGKAAYSEALLAVSVSRRSIAACPLAFGETGVKSRVKSVLNYKKPAFWIILVAIVACIAIAVCFLTVPKKQKGTYIGTWELSKLIEEGQEFDAAFLAMFGMDKDTIVLDADGTGKRTLVTGSETQEWPATYTADGNELIIEFTMSGKYEYRTTETAVYDPKSDTLSLVSEYETYVYTRAGSDQPVSGEPLTLDRLIGVWRMGFELSPDDPGLLSGTLTFRKDGSASLDLSTNGRPMQEECTFTLNGNTIELISGGQSSPVSYDPAHDTLSLPIVNVGILIFTRTNEPMPDLNDASLCTVWSLAAIEAPDGHRDSPAVILMEDYLEFRSDGTVHFIERNQENYTEDTLPYTRSGNTVTIDGTPLLYDPESGELRRSDPDPDDIAVWVFTRTPNVDLPLTEAAFVGVWKVTSMHIDDAYVTEDEAYRQYRELTVELYRSGKASIRGADSLRESGYTWSIDGDDGVSDIAIRLHDAAANTDLFLSWSNDLLGIFAADLFDGTDPDLYLTLERDPLTPLPSQEIAVSSETTPQPTKSGDLSKEQADAFVSGLSVEFEDGAPYGCDLVCYIDGFGKCLNIGDPEAYKSASLRFEPTEERIKPIYPHFTYAKILSVGDREYYLGNIRVSKSDDQMRENEFWDTDRPDADASIFVTVDSSMMERNRACPERVCVIKAFDAEKREVTISFAELDKPEEDGYPATVNYDAVEEETYTFRVTDDTMLSLIVDYQVLVKSDRFFRYLEEFQWYLNGIGYDEDDYGIGFWIGFDGDALLYLCEVYEE